MIRTSLFVAALLAAAAVPAAAQGTIRAGQTVQGELSEDDPTGEDDSHYDVWRFRGQAGHVYVVTLRSDDFDAYLAVGSDAADCDDCESDDDGAGGTDSRVEFRAEEDGMYEIRANSLMGGETGAYTLELRDEGERELAEDEEDEEYVEVEYAEEEFFEEIEAVAVPIRSGPAVSGELTEDDGRLGDGSYYDLYTYRGRAGEAVTVSLSSEAFDAYLVIGRMVDGEFESLESNDDGPAGTDSLLRITLPEDGEYAIRANSLSAGETGAYTLRLTRG
jgi:hypothetical protein